MAESAPLKKATKSLWAWMLDSAIEHWPAIIIAAIGGGGMTYLAQASTWLNAYGPVAWGAVGLGSILVISFIYFLWGYARLQIELSAYTKAKASGPGANVLSPTHEHERINLSDFYHPYFRPTENARFEDCELMGPAYVVINGCSFLHGSFIECEIVIVRSDRPVKGAMMFKFCTFLRCNLYRVTWLMNYDQYKALPEEMRAKVPVISDGRIGEI